MKQRKVVGLLQGPQTISNQHQTGISCDLAWHMGSDKEIYFIVECPGFESLGQIIQVVDEIADQWLTEVKSILSKHVETVGTVCLASDAWTKNHRKFIATVFDFLELWRFKLFVTFSSSCQHPSQRRMLTSKTLRNSRGKRWGYQTTSGLAMTGQYIITRHRKGYFAQYQVKSC